MRTQKIRLASLVFIIAAVAAAALAASASAAPIFSLASKYGGYGSGEGSFKAPKGLDTDAAGNVWVADGENSRVVELGPEGQWLTQITGSGEHTLVNPVGVAFDDTSGNVWIADLSRNVVEEFNVKGEYIRKAASALVPWHIAVDSKGNLWANADAAQKKILKFKSNGELSKEVTATNSNFGFTTDSEDHLWVTNPEKGRLDEYSSEGAYMGQVGEGILGAGLEEATVDTEGNLWTVWGQYVRGITAKGKLFAEFSNEHPGLGGRHPLAPAANGNLWLGLATNGGQIQKWTATPSATTEAATAVGTGEATLNGSVNPHGLETTYQFEYRTSTGTWTAVGVPKVAGSGTEAIKENVKATGLPANTIVYFRIKATSSHGTAYGESQWFNAGTHEWGLQPTAEPTEATGSALNSVSCTASETCVAVGYYWPASGSRTMAKVETAGQWALTPTPNPSEAFYSSFYGVSCSAANACTAVGYSQKSSVNTGLAERWNGSSWSLQTVPLPAGAKSSFLNAVSCPASNDCTAVGYYQPESGSTKALVERWNGSSWSVVSTPTVEGATVTEFRGISCVSTSDCWAVGKATKGTEAALAEHWNGTAWSINSPSGAWLVRISCGSASSCVATGFTGLTMTRWNGTSWSTETAATPEGSKGNNNLTNVSCVSASACVATGSYLSSSKVTRELAESWNGSKWTVQSTSAPTFVEEAKGPSEGTANLNGGVSCTSASACTAVGSYLTASSNIWSMVEVRH